MIAIVVNVINKPVRFLLKKLIKCRLVSGIVLRLLIRVAEHKKEFKRPGSGKFKKEWVMHQYGRWVDTADDAVDTAIDFIVSALNNKKSSLTSSVKNETEDYIDNQVDKFLNNADNEKDD